MNKRIGLNSFTLKIIALVAMTIDHVGAILYPGVDGLRIVGRIAFPVFAFLIVEGYFHTKNVRKYLNRLFLYGILSEFFFDYFLYGEPVYLYAQNVFFTLYLGLLLVYICDTRINKKYNWLIVIGVGLIAAFTFCDYSVFGVAMIYSFYVFRNHIAAQFIVMVIINVLFMGGVQSYAVFAMLPIILYNGKPGKVGLKYLFYIYYPLHLLIIGLINYIR